MSKKDIILKKDCVFWGELGFGYSTDEKEEILNFTTSKGGRKLAVRFVKEVTSFLELEVFPVLTRKSAKSISQIHLFMQKQIVIAEKPEEINNCREFLQGIFNALERVSDVSEDNS